MTLTFDARADAAVRRAAANLFPHLAEGRHHSVTFAATSAWTRLDISVASDAPAPDLRSVDVRRRLRTVLAHAAEPFRSCWAENGKDGDDAFAITFEREAAFCLLRRRRLAKTALWRRHGDALGAITRRVSFLPIPCPMSGHLAAQLARDPEDVARGLAPNLTAWLNRQGLRVSGVDIRNGACRALTVADGPDFLGAAFDPRLDATTP